MSGRDIIVVGASAGGVEAISQLVSHLPPDLKAAVFVALHIPSQGISILPEILNRAIKRHQKNSLLKAVHPKDGEEIEYGKIYVAPPNRHLIIKNGYIHLARGPKENGNRPAIDPLFRTAARTYGYRAIGVVLSGVLDDGTAGLMAVKHQGGVAIVQDPDEAMYSGMPRNAIENVAVDRILPIAKIVPLLVELTEQTVAEKMKAVSSDMEMESDMAELELEAMQNPNRPGTPSPYACPDCGGVLWELDEDKLTRFRCRTGHAYSTDSLLAAQSEALEDALWNALRALEEKAALTKRMATQARDRKQSISARRFEEQAQSAYDRATLVRNLLLRGEGNGRGSLIPNGQELESQSVNKILVSGVAKEVGRAEGAEVVNTNNQQLTTNNQQPTTNNNRPAFYTVAICASAGGLNALSQVLSALPANFPAAVTVVQHVSRHHLSTIAAILSRRTALHIKQAEAGDDLEPGVVYVAPPDYHLLVNTERKICLSHSELVHFVRPSGDLLFESVAASFKQRAIAVVLTGTGVDGAMGVRAIKETGGTVIAQNQESSEFFGMPEAAINTGVVDLILPLDEIAATLVNLVTVS